MAKQSAFIREICARAEPALSKKKLALSVAEGSNGRVSVWLNNQ